MSKLLQRKTQSALKTSNAVQVLWWHSLLPSSTHLVKEMTSIYIKRKTHRKGMSLVSVANTEGPMVSSRLQSLRKRKLKQRIPFWSLMCPCPQELTYSQQTEDPSWAQSLSAKIYSSNHLMVSSAKETDLANSNRKTCTKFLRLAGKAGNWVHKMGRNKGKAGRRPAKITAKNQTQVANEHTPQ